MIQRLCNPILFEAGRNVPADVTADMLSLALVHFGCRNESTVKSQKKKKKKTLHTRVSKGLSGKAQNLSQLGFVWCQSSGQPVLICELEKANIARSVDSRFRTVPHILSVRF